MSSRSKLMMIGTSILLTSLIVVIGYLLLAPNEHLATRIAAFLLVLPCLVCVGWLAPFLWRETEWWYQLQLKRRGRVFNRALRGGLEAFGLALLCGAAAVLFGNPLNWLSPLVWLSILLVWGWRSAAQAG